MIQKFRKFLVIRLHFFPPENNKRVKLLNAKFRMCLLLSSGIQSGERETPPLGQVLKF